MERVLSMFDRYPSQRKVAALMLRYGISVGEDGNAYCNDVEISHSALGRAAGADRRVAKSTIDKIYRTPKLMNVFSRMRSMALLSEVAPQIGCTALEIIPVDPRMPGILAGVAGAIFDAGISIRQAVIDDTGRMDDARLIIVLDGPLPPEYLPRIRACKGVDRVILR